MDTEPYSEKKDMLRQLQLAELDVLKYTIRQFDANNIRWFLGYGTLLGAVRHQGFIPWDDDVDLFIPRPDYERLLQDSEVIIQEPYYLFDPSQKVTKYSSYLATIEDTRTRIERNINDKTITENVHIDIFPLDGAPSSKLAQIMLFYRLRLLYHMMRAARSAMNGLDVKKRSIIECIGIWLNQLTGWGKRHTVTEVVKSFNRVRLKRSYDDEKWTYVFTYDYGIKKSMFPKKWFNGGRKGLFEGLDVNIPLECEKVLGQIYGDYMTPVREEQRIQKHDYHIIK